MSFFIRDAPLVLLITVAAAGPSSAPPHLPVASASDDTSTMPSARTLKKLGPPKTANISSTSTGECQVVNHARVVAGGTARIIQGP